jgi:hypothetical protein
MPEITQTDDGLGVHHEFTALGAASWHMPEDSTETPEQPEDSEPK